MLWDQEQVLAERRRRDPKGAGALHSLVIKNIADRVDEGWNRFWDALKERRPKVRPPRPVKRERYRSITYPHTGTGPGCGTVGSSCPRSGRSGSTTTARSGAGSRP